jgi:hypothetical protein
MLSDSLEALLQSPQSFILPITLSTPTNDGVFIIILNEPIDVCLGRNACIHDDQRAVRSI